VIPELIGHGRRTDPNDDQRIEGVFDRDRRRRGHTNKDLQAEYRTEKKMALWG
jgi:hypothetical protein